MADVTELRMNVAALKRVDPYVKAILETATHVALYTFNAEGNEWEKTDVEGALFVYSRNGEPYHSMLIMNRLNTNNLVEPVTQGLDLQLQQPFLLYRNSSCRIFGVWFYDKDECIRIAAVLDKLVKESEMNKKMQDKSAVKNKQTSTSEQSVDIFTMLSRAQEDYNSNKNQANNRQIPGEECKPEMPQGVVDFFAKASGGASHFGAEKVAQGGGLFGPQQRKTGVELVADPGENNLKPLLQRLMSNPAHSVEHIEKQQRSVTPQSETVAAKRSKGKSQTNKDATKHNNNNNGVNFNKLRPLSSGNISDTIMFQSSTNGQSLPAGTSTTLVENGMSFLRITSPSRCPPLTSFFGTSLQTGSSSSMVMEVSTPDQRPLSAPLCSGVETPQKPALMPPTMFTSSATKDATSQLEMQSTPIVSNASVTAGAKPEVCPATVTSGASSSHLQDDGLIPVRPEPLTKNQLLQAFNYLVKNDPEFVNKLHEAYVKSFAEIIM